MNHYAMKTIPKKYLTKKAELNPPFSRLINSTCDRFLNFIAVLLCNADTIVYLYHTDQNVPTANSEHIYRQQLSQ